jgi:hypothetical protein
MNKQTNKQTNKKNKQKITNQTNKQCDQRYGLLTMSCNVGIYQNVKAPPGAQCVNHLYST